MKNKLFSTLAVIIMIGALFLSGFGGTIASYADDDSNVDAILNQLNEMSTDYSQMDDLMVVNGNTNAYTDKSDNGNVAHTFKKGDALFVTARENGWITVFYQGQNYYIPESSADKLATDTSIDMEQVGKELEEIAATERIMIEEVERVRAEKRRAMIGGIIIVIIVIIVMIFGIISMLRNKKIQDSEADEESADEVLEIVELDSNSNDNSSGREWVDDVDISDIIEDIEAESEPTDEELEEILKSIEE